MPLMVEVEENPNCQGVPLLAFSTVSAIRPITDVKTARGSNAVAFHSVTGWSSKDGGSPCPAYAVRIEDSGSGLGTLVYGGDWGIRLMPPEVEEPWDIRSPRQWGEPFLVLDYNVEVRFV